MKSRFIIKVKYRGKVKLVEALAVDLWEALVGLLQVYKGAEFIKLESVTPEEVQGRA